MSEPIGLREGVVRTARAMTGYGLNRGTAGNVSVRCGDGFLVTPTGLPSEDMKPEDVVAMDFAGQATGRRAPSSEWRFHRDILAARPEVACVLHAHSPFATTLACLGRGVPAFHYMVAVAGGRDIRCAPYATFGTQELSDHALAALKERRACLLANHGLIVLGPSPERTLALAVEIEGLCELYWRVLLAGTPSLLSDEQMEIVLEKFKSYGQPRD